MTLDEFSQRIQTISDRRLQRMLDRARQEGPEQALILLEREKQNREEFPSGSAMPADPAAELSSQIRPLDEVLGAPRAMPAYAAEPRHHSIAENFAAAEYASPAQGQTPAAETKPSSEERETTEEMTPVESPFDHPNRYAELLGVDQPRQGLEGRGRGLAVVAILLLVLAGCLALWRALVG